MSTNTSDSEGEGSGVDDRLVPVDSTDRCLAEVNEGNLSPLSEVKSNLNVQVSGSQVDQVGARINNHAENITFVLQVQPQEQGRLTNLVLEKLGPSEAGKRISTHHKSMCLTVTVFSVVLFICTVTSVLVLVSYFSRTVSNASSDSLVSTENKKINNSLVSSDPRVDVLVVKTPPLEKNAIQKNKNTHTMNIITKTTESNLVIKFENSYNGSENISNGYSNEKIKVLPGSSNTFLSPTVLSEQNTTSCNDQRTLCLSRIDKFLSVQHLTHNKYYNSNSYKKSHNVDIIIDLCEKFDTFKCIVDHYNYPYINYNFVLSEDLLMVADGWSQNFNHKSALQILFIVRHNEIKDKQIYRCLLLINASVRCGFLYRNITVEIVGVQFINDLPDYNKFIGIINASQEDKYLVDDRERFVSDTVILSQKVGIPVDCLDVFETCNVTSTCKQQDCLQHVCEVQAEGKEICFLQCL